MTEPISVSSNKIDAIFINSEHDNSSDSISLTLNLM